MIPEKAHMNIMTALVTTQKLELSLHSKWIYAVSYSSCLLYVMRGGRKENTGP
jgi:hypothetical protein